MLAALDGACSEMRSRDFEYYIFAAINSLLQM